jgi:hypothetical protein
MRDAKKKKRLPGSPGIKNPGNKYSPETIQRIRALRGSMTAQKVAETVGVSYHLVLKVFAGAVWKNLPS